MLVDYIFKNSDFDYVLTGNISSDFIEGRFGWYRQLCGANYYNSVLQMLQAEKRIRLRSLINMGFNLKNIHKLFEDNDNGALLVHDVCKLVDSIPENCFEQLLADADQAIVYSLSGYAAKNIIKNVKNCTGCIDLLSPGKASLTPVFDTDEENNENEIEAKEEFLRLITRGGLIKPSDALFVACCHSWSLYQSIVNNDNSKNVLLASHNSRETFIEVLIQKLDQNESSRKLLEIKCQKTHYFKDHIKKAGQTMFNLFAKNLINDRNSAIHQTRKRIIKDPKSSTNSRKLKKISSN